jgi:two-component system, response regulator PdtaR
MQPFEAPAVLVGCSEIFNMARCEGVVLVVEDHPLVRKGVLEVVIEAGFETLEASDASEAIRILEARPDIHLVFTDAEMPGTMDGIELAHYIRDRWPSVRLIVVSGKFVIDPPKLPLGAKFFAKPYRETSVVEAMTGMLVDA